MMLGSVLEFITQAASSSAFIFCFCNLIIVIILVDLKPSLSLHQESEIHLFKGANDQKQGANSKPLVEKDTTPMPQVVEVEVSHDHEAETVENIEIEGNDDCGNEEEEKVEQEKDEDKSEKDDTNDELRKRVEEFIQKVNKGWKEELLSNQAWYRTQIMRKVRP